MTGWILHYNNTGFPCQNSSEQALPAELITWLRLHADIIGRSILMNSRPSTAGGRVAISRTDVCRNSYHCQKFLITEFQFISLIWFALHSKAESWQKLFPNYQYCLHSEFWRQRRTSDIGSVSWWTSFGVTPPRNTPAPSSPSSTA